MKNPFSTASSAERLFEDELYARVYEEIESGQMDKAAQARAIEEGGGDNGAVKKAYIKHRMARIKAEIEIAKERAAQEQAKANAEAERERIKAEAERERVKKEQKRLKEEENDGWTIGAYVIVTIIIIGPITIAMLSQW